MRGGSGGPRPDPQAGLRARRAKADAFAAAVGPIARELRDGGMSLNRVAAALAERGIPTPRRRAWTATAVRNLLSRLAAVGTA